MDERNRPDRHGAGRVTAYGLLASCVWAGVALYALRRAFALVESRRAQPVADDVVPLPPDLAAFVNKFSTDWARADSEKAIRERYERMRDWNAVRRAVGLGVMEG